MAEETQMVAEAAQAAEAGGGLGTLGINLKIFIAQLVNFAVVLFVLWKWAYQPIVNRLESRRERIEAGIKKADQAEEKLTALEQERKKIVSEAKMESRDILEQARADAQERKQEMISDAKREVERIVAQGKGALKHEKEAMLKDVRKEIVDIAVLASQKILKEGVDQKKSESLAKEVVRKMT